MTSTTALDQKSRPLRAAIEEQARRLGCGFASRWVDGRKSWIYDLTGRLDGVEVVVVEDGSKVFFVSEMDRRLDRSASTPRGVATVFTWLMAMLYPSDGLRRSK